MRISNLDIDVITRRYFEPCVKFNRGVAIANEIETVVVSVRAHVNVALENPAVGGGSSVTKGDHKGGLQWSPHVSQRHGSVQASAAADKQGVRQCG